jgi:hypothetical protein
MPFIESAKEFLAKHSTDEAPPIEVTGGIQHQVWLCCNGASAETSFGGTLLAPPPSSTEGRLQARARYWGIVSERATAAFEQFKTDLLLAGAPEQDGQLARLKRLRFEAREAARKARLYALDEDPGYAAQRAMLERQKAAAAAFAAKVLEVKR